mgnify:CR=1 FL=1
MAKDPAFLFYPGDYLKDTQCLSEKSQVAYDRIMCEHMRNISEHMNNITITKERVDFFTKRLSADEKAEVFHVLTKIGSNYQIEWVAESICKRKSYSESRAKNREGKTKEHMLTYETHMENANENTIINKESLSPKMVEVFKKSYPFYPVDEKMDFTSCLQIAYKIAKQKGWTKESVLNGNLPQTLEAWEKIVSFSTTDKWYATRSISDFNREFQRIVQGMVHVNKWQKEEKAQPTAPPLTRLKAE